MLRFLLGVPASAAAIILLRIHLYGEAWTDRTVALVCIVVIGAIGGSLALLPFRSTFQRRRTRLVIGGLIFGCAFMASMGVSYVFNMMVIAETVETHPDFPLLHILFIGMQVFGLFLISAPTYLMVWPLPLLTLIAVLLLPAARKGV